MAVLALSVWVRTNAVGWGLSSKDDGAMSMAAGAMSLSVQERSESIRGSMGADCLASMLPVNRQVVGFGDHAFGWDFSNFLSVLLFFIPLGESLVGCDGGSRRRKLNQRGGLNRIRMK